MNSIKMNLGYVRLSRDDELQGESNSIVNQKLMIEEYAERNGFKNIRHFWDDGVTGTTFDREGFQEMMKEVEAGNVATVILKDMSRLGRDYLRVGLCMETMREHGVRLIAINDGVDTLKNDDDFTPIRNIMNVMFEQRMEMKWQYIDVLLNIKNSAQSEMPTNCILFLFLSTAISIDELSRLDASYGRRYNVTYSLLLEGVMYKVLDLFCGCGGMSWGLHKSGFEIIAGIDIWDIALKTFKHNHSNSLALNLDISKSNLETISNLFSLEYGELDVLVGGPPCQGFSKNTPASSRFLEDERNQLYKSFIMYVKALNPKVVVIENVAEIYNAYNGVVREEIISTLQDLGYTVDTQIINMSHYGIPQKRRRCFFLASRIAVPQFPPNQDKVLSAWDAISDLPIVNQGEDVTKYDCLPSNSYQKKMRRDSTKLTNHIGRKMSEIQNSRISYLKAGEGLKNLPEDLKVKSGYSGAYGRLDYESVAPTITRWVFHVGSGRFSHPREVRGITMREAARIQSFSDDFEFLGSNNEQAGQIGNAVPPLFMEQLAKSIINCMKD